MELSPRFALGQYWLGLTAMKTRDNVLARKAFQETIKLAPDSEQTVLVNSPPVEQKRVRPLTPVSFVFK